jgi:hypothetical protein
MSRQDAEHLVHQVAAARSGEQANDLIPLKPVTLVKPSPSFMT